MKYKNYLESLSEASPDFKLVPLKDYKEIVNKGITKIESLLEKRLRTKVSLTAKNSDFNAYEDTHSKGLSPDNVFDFINFKCYIFPEFLKDYSSFKCVIVCGISITNSSDEFGNSNRNDMMYKHMGEITFKDNGDILKVSFI